MRYEIKIMKRNALGNMESVVISLPNIETILTEDDIAQVEIAINSCVPQIRVHINTVERNEQDSEEN